MDFKYLFVASARVKSAHVTTQMNRGPSCLFAFTGGLRTSGFSEDLGAATAGSWKAERFLCLWLFRALSPSGICRSNWRRSAHLFPFAHAGPAEQSVDKGSQPGWGQASASCLQTLGHLPTHTEQDAYLEGRTFYN